MYRDGAVAIAPAGSENGSRERFGRVTAAAAVVAVGATLAVSAAAGPADAKQRVALEAKTSSTAFVLEPLADGIVSRDSGTASSCCRTQRVVVRDGQTIEITEPVTTLAGTRGRLVVRFRIEWVEVGDGSAVGTGTWKVVRGTGRYARLAGGGRSAHLRPPGGSVRWRAEGHLGRTT